MGGARAPMSIAMRKYKNYFIAAKHSSPRRGISISVFGNSLARVHYYIVGREGGAGWLFFVVGGAKKLRYKSVANQRLAEKIMFYSIKKL